MNNVCLLNSNFQNCKIKTKTGSLKYRSTVLVFFSCSFLAVFLTSCPEKTIGKNGPNELYKLFVKINRYNELAFWHGV